MSELLHLHIQLNGIKPPIWRAVAVPDWITLKQLHQVIQIAFAWEDCHLYDFQIAGHRYADYDSNWDFDEPALKAGKAVLGLCLLGKKAFTYTYDFGDDWVHKITVKKSIPMTDSTYSSVCLGGARAAPPEDIGGIGGYDYEPEVFNQSRVDRLLLKLKFKLKSKP